MDKSQFTDLVKSFSKAKILVVGDIMLDQYTNCSVSRISPEGPVPIAQIKEETYFLGGAANVAHNVMALGAKVFLVGVVGKDMEADRIKDLVRGLQIDTHAIVEDDSRQTTVKRRIVSGSHQILRIDKEDLEDVNDKVTSNLISVITPLISEVQAIIISDYCKGVCTRILIDHIKREASKHDVKVFVDTKNKHVEFYQGVYVIKPNRVEAEQFANVKISNDLSNLKEVGLNIATTYSSNVIITLGSDGVSLHQPDLFVHIPTNALKVFDVSGAGDTFLATVAVASSAGATLSSAVNVANMAAGYVVSQLGTAVCTPEEILRQQTFL